MRLSAVSALILVAAVSTAQADIVTTTTFESVSLPTSGYLNNSQPGLTVDGNFFNNSYSTFDGPPVMTFWSGWAISNKTDKANPAWENQYSAVTGSGAGGSANYAVAFGSSAFINVADGQSLLSMAVTNTAYAYYSITEGDQFTPAFTNGDYFRLTITGYEGLGRSGAVINQQDVYLADYRNGLEYALNAWSTIDLTGMGAAKSLGFSFTTTKWNDFGPLTPAYFAMDDFRTFVPSAAVPEPAGLVMMGVGLLGATGLVRRKLKAAV